jgi:hypothetical protein
VRLAGLEPARLSPLPPQSSVSANSTISATVGPRIICQKRRQSASADGELSRLRLKVGEILLERFSCFGERGRLDRRFRRLAENSCRTPSSLNGQGRIRRRLSGETPARATGTVAQIRLHSSAVPTFETDGCQDELKNCQNFPGVLYLSVSILLLLREWLVSAGPLGNMDLMGKSRAFRKN